MTLNHTELSTLVSRLVSQTDFTNLQIILLHNFGIVVQRVNEFEYEIDEESAEEWNVDSFLAQKEWERENIFESRF